MESRVLNYTTDNHPKCHIDGPLKMILWAGDMVDNGITDIERLPGYDVYLCFGFTKTIQPNIDYIYSRETPGYICIVDARSEEQMSRFIKEFRGRFSYIDSDYRGNTPWMNPEYYYDLLQDGGKAFNVEGINGSYMYRGDYINALETFAPILPSKLNDERRYTEAMLQLAKDNNLDVDMAWTSPDLKDPYYTSIRENQNIYSSYRKSLNPYHVGARMLGENDLEDYWSKLSETVMSFNIDNAERETKCSLDELFGSSWQRFKNYLIKRVENCVNNKEEFNEYTAEDFGRVQLILKFISTAKRFVGFRTHYGFYEDPRKNGNPRVYGMWLEKDRSAIKNNADE